MQHKQPLRPDTWVWVVVQDPDGHEQFLGQVDEKDDVAFIPAFYEKEDAQRCFTRMVRQKGQKYEVQALFYDELAKDAAKNGFMIFMLNADGEIIEKVHP